MSIILLDICGRMGDKKPLELPDKVAHTRYIRGLLACYFYST